MAVESVEDKAVNEALEEVAWPQTEISINDITEIETGVNDVYTFATGLDTPARAVCKFATFSVPSAFQAGVTATHLLAEHTEIPVPGVYALSVASNAKLGAQTDIREHSSTPTARLEATLSVARHFCQDTRLSAPI